MAVPEDVRGKAILAPMTSVGTPAFVALCAELGAPVVFPGMVSARSISQGDYIINRVETKAYYGVQLFGTKPSDFEGAARRLAGTADILDINAGCPSENVTITGSGCAFMADPKSIGECVKACTKYSDHVWVKFRLGFDENTRNYLSVAKAAVESGAEALTLHPRPCVHSYETASHWDSITDLVNEYGSQAFIIGNGDIFSPEDFRRMLDTTGCQAAMLGRGAMKSPGLFSEINLDKNVSKTSIMERYLNIALDIGEPIKYIRLQLTRLSSGMVDARQFRRDIMKANDSEITLFTENFIDKQPK